MTIHKGTLILIIAMVFISCKTVDLELKTETVRDIQTTETEEQNDEISVTVEEIIATVDMEKQIIYVDKPIVLPPLETPLQKISGKEGAEKAMENFVDPVLENGSSLVSPYNPDEVYRIYTQVLQITNIYLEPGEVMIGDPAISDKLRFILGAGVSRSNGLERQHVYVKPTEAGLTATLIINTNRRVYNLRLYSYTNLYTPIVRWIYFDSDLPKAFAGLDGKNVEIAGNLDTIDPRLLSTDYKMSYNVFSKPDWTPQLVYDDGKKTYIVVPDIVLQRELPGCFENKKDIINYRVIGNLFIIDKLVDKVTLAYKNQKITIWKK